MKDDNYYLCHTCGKQTARKEFAVFTEKWEDITLKCIRTRICKTCKNEKN